MWRFRAVAICFAWNCAVYRISRDECSALREGVVCEPLGAPRQGIR